MRKIVASIALLTFMFVYIAVVAGLGSQITEANGFLQLAFYVLAGFGWIIPIRPLFRWMNTPPDEPV
ncbi:MAG: DUF2842 domain-containing protein [Pseudomonadota bacterium]